MVLADIGRVPIVDRDSQRLVGLVARKDLLRIRATAKSAEVNRVAYFGHGTSDNGDEEAASPAKAVAGS
jgi:CIC family chloride channel protein